MPPEPVPADPGPDGDLAWLDRDPEREVSLDRARDDDEPPEPGEEECEPLTPEELAGIGQAAADELLAVKAATAGRRGPGQPGSARVFPGESASPAAGFGPGMALDLLPGVRGDGSLPRGVRGVGSPREKEKEKEKEKKQGGSGGDRSPRDNRVRPGGRR